MLWSYFYKNNSLLTFRALCGELGLLSHKNTNIPVILFFQSSIFFCTKSHGRTQAGQSIAIQIHEKWEHIVVIAQSLLIPL